MTIQTAMTGTATELLRSYQSVRKESMTICAPLDTEDYVVQPIEDVSPPKWHLGHTTWFFENFILKDYLNGYQLFDEQLNYIFNSYYESQGERILRSNRGNISRPGVERVMAYRAYVDQHMEKLLEQEEQLSDKLTHLLTVGLQHEQQHQELLLTDIKYILGTNPLFPVYRDQQLASVPPADAEFIRIQEGLYEVGYEGDGFCWDNEQSRHKVYLHEYQLMNRLITNGEYLEFMEAGGYEHFGYWLGEGWQWSKTLDVKAPLYWYKKDSQWHQFTLNGLKKLDLNQPVTHLSYYEADAYANWKGMRLPTEFEWEVACQQYYTEIPKDGNFLETRNYHPTAQQQTNDLQMLGQTWEWTASAYLPYPDYPRFKGALGEYNGKFMVNQMVLRGGSCATPISHIRPTYRNFFHADKRWQFTGLRLAK